MHPPGDTAANEGLLAVLSPAAIQLAASCLTADALDILRSGPLGIRVRRATASCGFNSAELMRRAAASGAPPEGGLADGVPCRLPLGGAYGGEGPVRVAHARVAQSLAPGRDTDQAPLAAGPVPGRVLSPPDGRAELPSKKARRSEQQRDKRLANVAKAVEARTGRTASAPAKGKSSGAAVTPFPSRLSGRGKASKAGYTRANAAGNVPAASLTTAGKGGPRWGGVVLAVLSLACSLAENQAKDD